MRAGLYVFTRRRQPDCALPKEVTMNHKRSFISIVLATIVLVSLCAVCVSSASVSAAGNAGGTSGAKTAGVATSLTLPAGTVGAIPELSWTKGQSFPVVNGRTIFPSLATPVAPESPPAYDTHWYASSGYSGSDTARTISMSIGIPNSAPLSDEFYYVLLSAFDNSGSYDQLGFSNTYGTWGLTYSWTSGGPSNPTYHYNPNAMALTPGATYTFIITTDAGVTHFDAYQGSTQVWTLDASTGGNNLVLSATYSGYYDYTNYEEVWQTHSSGGSPAFDFYFYDNYWVPLGGGKNAPTWTTWFSAAPSDVAVRLNGNTVLVDNPLGGWGTWTSIGGKIIGAPAVSTWAPDSISLELFARGTNDQLYIKGYDQIEGVWGPWTSLGGKLTSAPGVVSRDSGLMDVFVRGSDGALYSRWTSDGARSWTPWYTVGGQLLADTGPAAYAYGGSGGTIGVFVTGTNHHLYHLNWDGSGWKDLGGYLTSSPAVVTPAPGYIQVYGRGSDGALYSRWSGNGGSTWTPWYKPTAGSPLAGTGPGGNSAPVNTQDLIVTGKNSVPYWSHWTLSTGFAPFLSIGSGKLTSSPAVSDLFGSIQVFGRGTDGAVYMIGYWGY